MNSDQSFKSLYLVSKNRLNAQPTPEGDRRMIIPSEDDALYGAVSLTNKEGGEITDFEHASALELIPLGLWPS